MRVLAWEGEGWRRAMEGDGRCLMEMQTPGKGGLEPTSSAGDGLGEMAGRCS